MSVANKQTIATKKYQEKISMIAKTYKLRKEVVEEFSKACELAGVSQAAQLTKMMKAFSKTVIGELPASE